MQNKHLIYILLSLSQVVALWYSFIRLTEKLELEFLASILSMPLIMTFPVGTYFGMFLVAFYMVIWFWFEPLIYFLFLRRRFFISHNKYRRVKEASFLIVPLIFFAFTSSSEVNYYSNSSYFNSEHRPRCAIREYGNHLPEDDEYKRICTDRSGCECRITLNFMRHS